MMCDFVEQPLLGCLGAFLAVVWLSRVLAAALNMGSVAEITTTEFDATPRDGTGRVPRVSIIVPARNEAGHIETALLSLLELDYPDYEVIAVDDRSDDATGAILDQLRSAWRDRGEAFHHRLTVLHIRELPSGWLGKTHAMWQAANQATGDWLLFTDADVVFRPDALRRAVVYAERERADHVVLFPTMVMESSGERMMMAFFSHSLCLRAGRGRSPTRNRGTRLGWEPSISYDARRMNSWAHIGACAWPCWMT